MKQTRKQVVKNLERKKNRKKRSGSARDVHIDTVHGTLAQCRYTLKWKGCSTASNKFEKNKVEKNCVTIGKYCVLGVDER